MNSDGTRRGDSLLLLSSNREIARDNLWAIRALPAVLIVGIVLMEVFDSSPSTQLIDSITGIIIISIPLYWIALWLSSSPIEEDSEEGG